MSARLTVLIVDDTELIRRLLKTFISSLGHTTILTSNGLEAVEYCRSNRPDMILMDVMMPGMDGYQATSEIRKNLGDVWIPIIFLTALSDQANFMKGLEVGGDDYLHKPIDFTLLSAKINVLLRIRQLQSRIVADSERLEKYFNENEEEQRLAQHILANFNPQSESLQRQVQQWLKPALKFSGDVVSVERSPNGNLHIMLADSTGHGLSAAICCLPAISAFVAMTKRGFDINTISREINDTVHKQLPTGRFVAAVLISVDYLDQTISIWNGGIPCVFYMSLEGHIVRHFASTHTPLGILSDDEFDSGIEVFRWGMEGRLIIVSDGVTEATNPEGKEFGLGGVITAASAAVGEQTAQSIFRAMLDHVGTGENHDDASLVLVHCTQSSADHLPKPSSPPRLAHTFSTNWELKLTFTAEQLREEDCFQAIVGWLNQLGLEQSQFSSVLLILSELFNNALDHGILGLSSELKNGDGGFEKYLLARHDLLQRLEQGEISLGLSRRQASRNESSPKLNLWIADSGPGFDFEKVNSATHDDSEKIHGRGLALIAQMSDSIHYVGNGNRVEVTFNL